MNFDLQNNKTSQKKQKLLQLNSPQSKIKNDLFDFFLKTPDSNYSKEYSPYIIKNRNYSNSVFKTQNTLTDIKVQSNKIYSPSPKESKTEKLSDRFIPMNSRLNLMEKFNLAKKFSLEFDENTNNSNITTTEKNPNYIYNEILKQNVLNENSFSLNPEYSSSSNNLSSSISIIKKNIFSFKSEQKPKENFYSILNNQKENENNTSRKIAQKPFKILPAPNLLDDFYLNLLDWSSNNDIAVALGNSVHLWCMNQTSESILFTYDSPEKYISSLIFSNDSSILAVGTSEGTIELYDLNKNMQISTFASHKSRVGVVAWNQNLISSGSKDYSIVTRDTRMNNSHSYNNVAKLLGHTQEVCGLKWSFDGSQLASGGNDNKLMIWTLHSRIPLMACQSHQAAVKAIAWSPHQSNILVSGGGTADRTIRFWNTSIMRMESVIDTGSQVCNLVFSKTCSEFVSTHGFSLNQIIVWKYPSLKKVTTLTGHKHRVLYLGISPDGQSIVTAAGDETMRFWNLFPPFKSGEMSGLFPSNQDIR
jgi:cell division cycle 20-like protein 1 (cofactor of APC complex)